MDLSAGAHAGDDVNEGCKGVRVALFTGAENCQGAGRRRPLLWESRRREAFCADNSSGGGRRGQTPATIEAEIDAPCPGAEMRRAAPSKAGIAGKSHRLV
eukprot:CAMPEP_0170578424 /NCGR_PEP_ID=MMETSP0224-20130122/5448_1 /TAXON_ID=285029 /ORGANISM="Togula jolla, Strain CCCM 725" /LENGTH=99 /DNA_ID=CAMNT_0010901391 /DNA_START=277 /DNA_END=575 /DNA_ORIENTATION=+